LIGDLAFFVLAKQKYSARTVLVCVFDVGFLFTWLGYSTRKSLSSKPRKLFSRQQGGSQAELLFLQSQTMSKLKLLFKKS
jgi:hypothetical protein